MRYQIGTSPSERMDALRRRREKPAALPSYPIQTFEGVPGASLGPHPFMGVGHACAACSAGRGIQGLGAAEPSNASRYLAYGALAFGAVFLGAIVFQGKDTRRRR